MEISNKMTSNSKQRHGCVTAWLILIIIANSLTALFFLAAGKLVYKIAPEESLNFMLFPSAILSIANVIFSIMLLKWKKLGFYGFIITAIGILIINLYVGLDVILSFIGLFGIVALYGVLQIEKDNVSAWSNLEGVNIEFKSNINSGFKSRKVMKKAKLEEDERLRKQAEEEIERNKRRKEKEDPSRFMPR